jgi:DNA repair exonuclease SbcCD nuclease subunit
MKFLFTGDWHLDAITAGVERFDDVSTSLDWVARVAQEEGVAHVIFLGDLCDPDANRAPRCVARAIGFAEHLHETGINTWWLTGNHDVIEDGSGTSTLVPLGAAGHNLVDTPRVESLYGVSFAFLPFVPRSKAYDPVDFIERASTSVSGPVIIAGHLSSRDIEPGSETHEMGRGRDQWIPLDAIKERFKDRALVVNGHYHQWQTEDVLLPGSLERLTFGEEANEPSVAIVEVTSHATRPKFSIKRVKNPHSRKLKTYQEHDAIWESGGEIASPKERDTIVRLKPPASADQDRIASVVENMKLATAAIKFVPPMQDSVATNKPVQKAVQQKARPREVVMSLIERVNSLEFDKADLLRVMEEIMDSEGI